MKTFVLNALVAFLLFMAACTTNRPPAVNAPADGAEYYQPSRPTYAGQQRLYPDPQGGLGHSQDPDIRLTDVRLTASYTVLYLTFAKDKNDRYGNFYGSSSISFNPKAVLATSDGKRTYALLKTDGIPTTPNTREIRNDERVPFVLYFERLDRDVEQFDLFECKSDNQSSCFNIAGIRVPGIADATARPPR